MSTLPENELDLDKLFLPAWAQEPASAKHYANFTGEVERPERRGDRGGRRPPRREGGFGERPREGRPRRDQRGEPRGPRGGPNDRRGPADRDRSFPRDEQRERREPPAPLPEINLAFIPDEKGVESLARQIKTTGRAYPLFDIARLILQKPERYSVNFSVKKNAEGQPVQPLFVCALDDTLWLSEDEAVANVLKVHFATFYQTDRTATEPPKGKYTFVAQCGMSGVILGPPNHHDYQNQLHKLHAQRFSRMPFDVFKARVKIVRDEEVVKKWVDDQSWKTEFVCLNMPEPLRLGNREAVEKHFREVHKDNIIKPVEAHTLNGVAARSLRSLELTRLVRLAAEDQRRFPLQLATTLSQRFAAHGLQFFKVNRAITHVSVARPHFLDLETTPVSNGVRQIVEFINSHPKCTRRQLFETLAPSPAPAPVPLPVPAPTATSAPAAPPTAEPAPPPVQSAEPTPEQTAVVSDLHWLIHQGHVIEFANGIIETAKKPLPKPPKPEAKPAAQPAEPPPAGESAPMGEILAESASDAEPAAAGAAENMATVESAIPVAAASPRPVQTSAPSEAPVETPASAPESNPSQS